MKNAGRGEVQSTSFLSVIVLKIERKEWVLKQKLKLPRQNFVKFSVGGATVRKLLCFYINKPVWVGGWGYSVQMWIVGPCSVRVGPYLQNFVLTVRKFYITLTTTSDYNDKFWLSGWVKIKAFQLNSSKIRGLPTSRQGSWITRFE